MGRRARAGGSAPVRSALGWARVLVGCWLGALAGAAEAAHVGVLVTQADGPVERYGVEAIAWHALYQRQGLDALLLDGGLKDAPAQLRRADLATLYEVSVGWGPQVVRLSEVSFAAPLAPEILVVEWALTGDQLVERQRWTTVGAASLYRVLGEEAVVSYPEVALQEAMSVAVGGALAPAWGPTGTGLLIPIVVTADEEYRAFYGPDWREVARRRVERASRLLGQAGIGLSIVGWQAWESPQEAGDLSSLLEAQAEADLPPGAALRLGFTQQTSLARLPTQVEDVGRAFVPGRDVIVADQATAPGHLPEWDEAEESVAISHEVLHALGVPHQEVAGYLMSRVKTSLVARMAPSTRALARTAAQVRVAFWDAELAMVALEREARTWLYADPELQADYIAENVASGPGVPPPGALVPERMSALTNVAMGRYYLRLAERGDGDRERHRAVALAHSQAALRMAPSSAVAAALAVRLEREPPLTGCSSPPDGR
jgi:hypothetical protein